MTDHYVINWIKAAITQEHIEAPDRSRLNGYGERAEVWEAMESLALVRQQGSLANAQELWRDKLTAFIPDVAAIVNRPRLIRHIDEFENEPPVEWLIPNELPSRAISVIYGPSGAAKSFLAIDYAGVIALKKPVIYIAGEGQSGYYARYKAWLTHCGYKKSGQFMLAPRAVQLLKPNEVSEFINEAAEIKPAVVFIDTLARSMVGGDENSQKDMGLFISGCDQIREQLGCAVVIIHHTGKTGDNERGSSVLRGAADMMIAVTNEEGTIKVSCGKSKDSKPFPHRYLRLKEITIEQNGKQVVSCVLDMWQKVKTDPDALTPNQTRLLECLASEIFSDGVRVPDLKGYANIGAGSTFYSALNTLMKRGFCYKKGKGAKIDPVVISETGKDWMRRHSRVNPDQISHDSSGM